MVTLLAAAAVLAAASPGMTATADQPAVFKVEDADTTIYLFGTFHALDGNRAWFDPAIRDAFDQSDELVLETVLPDRGAPASTAVRLHSPTAVSSGSFLATTRMALNAGRSQGMQVANGADMVLRRLAEANGKAVEGLETLELQLRMFDKLRVAGPVRSTAATNSKAKPAASLSQTMGEMQAAWKRGDQSVFVHMLNQLQAGSPETYQAMFVERNERWADWVAARMREPGTVFIAVGAGHLAGSDSLLVRLAERGVESHRVD